MAVEVEVPKDIKEYRERAIAGMILKQSLCLSIAAGVNTMISPIFIVWLKILVEVTSWLITLSSIPIVSFGWSKRNGLTFEAYIKQFFKYHFSPGIHKKQGVSVKEEKKVAEVVNVKTNKDTGGQET